MSLNLFKRKPNPWQVAADAVIERWTEKIARTADTVVIPAMPVPTGPGPVIPVDFLHAPIPSSARLADPLIYGEIACPERTDDGRRCENRTAHVWHARGRHTTSADWWTDFGDPVDHWTREVPA